MRFNPAAFDTFLGPGGAVTQLVGWRRAFACPCFNPASGAALPTCRVCGGRGRTWSDEVDGNCGITAQTPGKMYAQFGSWEPGDAVLTIPQISPLYAAGWFDRFRALDSTVPFSINLTRGENDVLSGTILSIDRVFWVENQDTIVEGGIPTVADDGTLTWAAGEPAAEAQYSITGVKSLEWFAYRQLPAHRNIGVHGLPLKLPVRSFDLFGR